MTDLDPEAVMIVQASLVRMLKCKLTILMVKEEEEARKASAAASVDH